MYWYLHFKADMDEAETPAAAHRALFDIERFVSDAIDEMSNRQAFHIAASAIAALADWSRKSELEVKTVPVLREIFDRMCYRVNDVINEIDISEALFAKAKEESDEELGEDEE